MTEVTGNEDTMFEDAFAQAAADAEKGVLTPVVKDDTKTVDDVAKEADKTKTPEELAAEQKAADEAAAAEKKDADEAALAAMSPEDRAAKEAANAEAAQVTKDGGDAAKRIQAKADADVAEKKKAEEAAAAAKAAEETPEQKKAREEFEASLVPYEPTAEEKAALAKFKEDFPESATAVEALLKSVDRAANARVYQTAQAMLAHFNNRLAPVETSAAELAMQAHFDAIHKAHADYDAVIDKVPDWIKTQSALLQPTLQKAFDEGDTQSVIDLVSMYKKAAGTVTETPEQAVAKQRAAADAAVKAKKAADEAAAMAPVNSKRTNPSPKGAPDKDDYDGAFAEAAAAAAGGK